MRENSRRADPRAAAQESADPAVNTMSTPIRGEKRFFIRRVIDRLHRFAIKLKAYAQWMKQFLHGAK